MSPNTKGSHPVSEFHRPVDTTRLHGAGIYDIAASAEERMALARRFGLISLDRLEAQVRVERLGGRIVRLTATMAAVLAQACVVTLEPVPTVIEDRFSLLYWIGGEEERREIVLTLEDETVEPLDAAILDIGEAVAQQLSLALDPFPRAPGAVAEAPSDGAVASPFAVLAKWKEKG